MFIAVSTQDKNTLSQEDIAQILSLFLSILFGFLIIIKQPLWLACIWFIFSCIAYLVIFRTVYIAKVDLARAKAAINQSSDSYERSMEQAERKLNLCNIFVYVMTLHIIVYLVAMTKMIGPDITRFGFQMSDISTKIMFAAAAMDVHVEILNPMTLMLINEKRANEARRSFLRYATKLILLK